MAKISKKLTNTEIKNTKPAEKEINLFDGDGLMLRIAPLSVGGKKNWYFRYPVPVTKKLTKKRTGQPGGRKLKTHYQLTRSCHTLSVICMI